MLKRLARQQKDAVPREFRNAWSSWDPSPAEHPWLTPENLRRMRTFSEDVWAAASRRGAYGRMRQFRYAFVGNLANNLYMRATSLRARGLDIAILMHPHDTYVMSQPGWEELDGPLLAVQRDVHELESLGFRLPHVPDVVSFEPHQPQLNGPSDVRKLVRANPFLRSHDIERFPAYLCFLQSLRYLQAKDALLTTQATYLAYLSGRPYLAAQGGGDLWIECSRDDALGEIQRLGFGCANAILGSNPWTFAHARRLGLRNAVYLPFMMDDDAYRPGEPVDRREWEERTGGRFFVLCTSRLDDRYKGSNVALEGFRLFASRCPEARLVILSWGEDEEKSHARLREWGIEHLTLVLPLAGKRRLVKHLRSADCLLDQFSLGAYGATALEAMGCGLPVVMRLKLDQYEALCERGAPPVLNAETAPEIAQALLVLARDPEKQRRLGEAHRAWFVASHGASRWAEAYANMLRATALGHRFDFRESPLAEPLSDVERDYHTEGLKATPPFPE